MQKIEQLKATEGGLLIEHLPVPAIAFAATRLRHWLEAGVQRHIFLHYAENRAAQSDRGRTFDRAPSCPRHRICGNPAKALARGRGSTAYLPSLCRKSSSSKRQR